FANGDGSLGRISTGGADPLGSLTKLTGPSPVAPISFASGPDGRVYFTDGNLISSIDVAMAGPGAPTDALAAAGNTQALVSWSPPAATGGSPVPGYTVVASPGGQTCTTSGSTSCTVTGLPNGTAATFTVYARNAIGIGAASTPSNAVTPSGVVDGATFFHAVTPQRILDSRPTSKVRPY